MDSQCLRDFEGNRRISRDFDRDFKGVRRGIVPETPKPLNLGIYLTSYEGSYYNLRSIP